MWSVRAQSPGRGCLGMLIRSLIKFIPKHSAHIQNARDWSILKHSIMCKHRGGNLFSTWDIEIRMIIEAETGEEETTREAAESAMRVSGNIILMELRYHLLKWYFNILLLIGRHICDRWSFPSHCLKSRNSRPAAHTARRPSHMNSFSLFLELRALFEKYSRSEQTCWGFGQKLNSMVEKWNTNIQIKSLFC